MILRRDRTGRYPFGSLAGRSAFAVLALVLGACARTEAPPETVESPVLGTVAATEEQNVPTMTTLPFPASVELEGGRLAVGPDEALVIDYLGFGPERWELTIGSVSLVTERGEGDDARPIAPQVQVEVTLTYLGDGSSGKLLDLVFALDTPNGLVDASREMCRPRPAEGIDLFSSVRKGSSVTGVLCFATQDTPSGLIVSPLIDESIRVGFTPG